MKFTIKLPQRNLYIHSSVSQLWKIEMDKGDEDASGDRIIQVGPCRMKFVAEDDHTSGSHGPGDLPASRENPRLMPLRDSSHLVQNKDSR